MRKWMKNAVYERELRRAVRDPKFPIFIAIFLLILATIGVSALIAIFSGKDNFIDLKNSFFVLYKVLFGLEFALLMLLIPSMTANTISGERENRTLELLFATTMSPYQIVIGKLFSSMSKVLLYIISSFPILGILFAVGKTDPMNMWEYLLLLVTTSFYIGSFGILMSVIFTKTTHAMIAAYFCLLFFCIGSILTMVGDNLLFGNSNTLDLIDYSLLFNPVATIYVMMSQQIGIIGEGLEFIIVENASKKDLLRSWFGISLALQLFVIFSNILLAGFFLNPLRKK